MLLFLELITATEIKVADQFLSANVSRTLRVRALVFTLSCNDTTYLLQRTKAFPIDLPVHRHDSETLTVKNNLGYLRFDLF